MALRKVLPGRNMLPQLPGKRLLGSSLSPDFVEQRRIQLCEYLRDLVSRPAVWSHQELVYFLDDEQRSLTLLWNFERMRKMQQMLGDMAYETQNRTDELEKELSSSRSEIHHLRDRMQPVGRIVDHRALAPQGGARGQDALCLGQRIGADGAAVGPVPVDWCQRVHSFSIR